MNPGTAPRMICLGLCTRDLVWHVPDLPQGGVKVRAHAYRVGGGGMAATAAVAAARLGAQVQFWGRAGNDEAGRALRAELQGRGVDVAQLRLFDGARSPVAAVLIDARGERMIAAHPGAHLPEAADWLPLTQVAACDAVLADARWPAGAQALLGAARTRGIPGVLDADVSDIAHFDRILPSADCAVFSEAALRTYSQASDLAVQLRFALDKGCQRAAVTRGARGVAWLDGGGALRELPAFAVRAVDTNGAGDVFHGALAFALGAHQPWEQALRFAAAAAALKCRHSGGRDAIPALPAVREFLQSKESSA